MPVSLRRPCRCGHDKDAHEHYRRGTDCGGCGCERFHGQLVITIRFGRMQPAVVVPEEVPYPEEPQVRPTHAVGLAAGRGEPASDRAAAPPPLVRPREGDNLVPEQSPTA
jgi:hypothetical protein